MRKPVALAILSSDAPSSVSYGAEAMLAVLVPSGRANRAVVPIVRLDPSSLRALAYAASVGRPVLAVHISPGADEAARFKRYWAVWGDHVPLGLVDSPTARSSPRLRATSTPCAASDGSSRRRWYCPSSSSSIAGSSSFTTAPPDGCGAPSAATREWLSPPSRFASRPDFNDRLRESSGPDCAPGRTLVDGTRSADADRRQA